MNKTNVPQLLDAPAFLFAPETGLNDLVVKRFLKLRPVGWELRQACELALLARIGPAEKHAAISSYLNDLAQRLEQNISLHELAAARVYAERLVAASSGQPWQASAESLATILSIVQPTIRKPAWPLINNVRNEMILCAENVARWESWLDRYGITAEPCVPEVALRPRQDVIASLVGIEAPSDISYVVDCAPNGATWRKWFVVPGRLEPDNLWFSTETSMSRARQFVWTGLHDAAHLFHQHLLKHNPTLFVLGVFPYWGISEAFACLIERRAFSALNDSTDKILGPILKKLAIDHYEVCTVLVEGFIEREGRFYRALLAQDPVAGALLAKTAPRMLVEAATSHSAMDFDALPAITWYYVRGHAAFGNTPERLLKLLRFETIFPHPKEFLE